MTLGYDMSVMTGVLVHDDLHRAQEAAYKRERAAYHLARVCVYDLFPYSRLPHPEALTDEQQTLIRRHEDAERQLSFFAHAARRFSRN
jgi:hypothetical protein